MTNVATGAAATAASKTAVCSTDKTICLVYGINQNNIGNGVIALATIQFPATASGVVPLAVTGVIAGDKIGGNLSAIAGAPLNVTVIPLADINSDGVINLADVTLMHTQAVGDAPCTEDQNGDGFCNVLDVLIVASKATVN